jgi:16S rRNA (cytosine967-C5)-methyltransferase
VEVVESGPALDLLRRAARPGRTRAVALALLAGVREHGSRPGVVLATGLREARHLHSAERRLVGDGVRGVIRDAAMLDEMSGRSDDLTRWLAWLVGQGLPPLEAAEQAEGVSLLGLEDRRSMIERSCSGLSGGAWVARRANCSMAFAEGLWASLGHDVAAFLDACDQRAPLDLRVNRTAATMERAQASLASAGIVVTQTPVARWGLRVVGRGNVVATEAYRAGVVEIQDEGSQVLAEIVDAREGLVLDYCAGAGGKTLALAEARGEVLACDVRASALSELRQRTRRAGIKNVRTVQLDRDGEWPKSSRFPVGVAERVLVDAPCSGSGTLRRHPEHRLRLCDEVLATYPPLQRAIARRAAEAVAPGGRLIYATCSVLRAENDDVVDALLEDLKDFRRVPLSEILGAERAGQVGDGDVLRLLPHIHGTDGFFGCVLRRDAR